MTITADVQDAIGKVPEEGWTSAYDGDGDGDGDGQVRKGAWVADVTGLLDLDGWPAGMRVIVRKERALAQITGSSAGRSCGSPTSTGTGSPASPPTRGKASSPT